MLFNKDNNGTNELQQLTGSYYTSNDWERTELFVDLAEQDMIDLLGKELYKRVDALYNPSEGSGSAGGGLEPGPEEEKINNQLLKLYRVPIALKAAFDLYQANLVSHEDQGRKVKINSTSEKMAWEWMLDRDDIAQLQLIGRTKDRLIRFLEENKITEWIESEQRKNQRNLFVNSVKIFEQTYPIDGSHAFLLSVLPFNMEVQRKHIKPILGDLYNDLLSAWQDHNEFAQEEEGSGSAGGGLPSSYNQDLIDLIQEALPLKVMELAVRRKSIKAMPDSVVQKFKSMIQTSNSSQVPMDTAVKSWLIDIEKEANEALEKLKDAVISLTSEPVERVFFTEDSADNKYLNL